MLQRLFSIILDNAIKYNKDNGEIIIRAFIKKDNNKVVIIKDMGIGIENNEIEKIFDRFYRVSEDRSEKGFGLGLAIAKDISSKLNINIDVMSKFNKGTEFIFTFR